MIRIEAKTAHKSFANYEATIEDAKAYVEGMIEAGVEFIEVNYFDRDEREAAIRRGEV